MRALTLPGNMRGVVRAREDHRAVDIRVIGLLPITPFSTLAMWPLTDLSPLAAKHGDTGEIPAAHSAWLAFALHYGSVVPARRAGVCTLLSAPSQPSVRPVLCRPAAVDRRGVLGVSAWISRSCGSARGHRGGLQDFPVVLFVFFLRRGSWRALISGAATGAVALAVSVAVFGWNLHRTYLHQILPSSLHGEGLPPYATASASISSVLHYLFLAEPQWNPHPSHRLAGYALLQPTPDAGACTAILLIRKSNRTPGRIALEWSALIAAYLVISTSPASYHFVLWCCRVCPGESSTRAQVVWLVDDSASRLYGICLPIAAQAEGWDPQSCCMCRGFLTLALLVGIYVLLWRDGRTGDDRVRDSREGVWVNWPNSYWPTCLGSRDDRGSRCSACGPRCNSNAPCARSTPTVCRFSHPPFLTQTPALPAAGSTTSPSLRTAITFCPRIRTSGLVTSPRLMNSPSPPTRAISRSRRRESTAADRECAGAGARFVDDAREPMLSADGQSLAFIRDDHGRGRLMLRTDFRGDASETALYAGCAQRL